MSCLLSETLGFKKNKKSWLGNLREEVCRQGIFSRAKAVRNTSGFLLRKIEVCWLSWNRENALEPDAFHPSQLPFPASAELSSSQSSLSLPLKTHARKIGCSQSVLTFCLEESRRPSTTLTLVKLPSNLLSSSVLFIFPLLRYKALRKLNFLLMSMFLLDVCKHSISLLLIKWLTA